jgi:hypothetical protein
MSPALHFNSDFATDTGGQMLLCGIGARLAADRTRYWDTLSEASTIRPNRNRQSGHSAKRTP